jgi:transposase
LGGELPIKTILPVPQPVFNRLLELLPEPRQKRRGRKRCPQEALLKGILLVLKQGISWNDLCLEEASGVSCWRYCQELQRRGCFHLIFETISKATLDTTECSIDTTSITSFRFKAETGWDGKHQKIATKVSLITEKNGLPVDIEVGKGSKHDLRFCPKHRENTRGRRIEWMNADKGYTSVELRRELRRSGTYLNMEMRVGDYVRKKGPKFRFDEEKYKQRFELEKLNGWIKSFRSLRLRRSYKVAMFKAFVFLALIVILLRNVEF